MLSRTMGRMHPGDHPRVDSVTIGSVCHKKTVETTSWGNIEITMPNGLLSRKSLLSTLEGAPPEDSAVDQAVRAARLEFALPQCAALQ